MRLQLPYHYALVACLPVLWEGLGTSMWMALTDHKSEALQFILERCVAMVCLLTVVQISTQSAAAFAGHREANICSMFLSSLSVSLAVWFMIADPFFRTIH